MFAVERPDRICRYTVGNVELPRAIPRILGIFVRSDLIDDLLNLDVGSVPIRCVLHQFNGGSGLPLGKHISTIGYPACSIMCVGAFIRIDWEGCRVRK